MKVSSPPPRVIRFGVFELDPRAGELRKGGLRVKLPDQSLRILAMLLKQPGDVVTREALRRELWPDGTFVDFDHSLNAAVNRLRDALGDAAENPRFVETLARRGYRFIAPVDGLGATGGARPVAPAEARAAHERSWPKRYWPAATGGLLVAALSGFLFVFRASWLNPRSPAPQPQLTQLTANPAADPVFVAAISPDGRYLAYADLAGFHLRLIDTGETRLFPAPPGLCFR